MSPNRSIRSSIVSRSVTVPSQSRTSFTRPLRSPPTGGSARRLRSCGPLALGADPKGVQLSDGEAHSAPSGSLVRGQQAVPREVVRVPLPTPAGEFDVRAFACASGSVLLVLVKGDLGNGRGVLTRLHSECLTGDALGSTRCDCGVQLRTALRVIASEGRGVLLYATGHEGRGIGLLNKLRAYVLQDEGLDTLEANRHLGFPPESRDYGEAAACLGAVGVRTVRLLTNNPHKETSLRRAGIEVDEVIALATSPHARNLNYLRAKERRMGHSRPAGESLREELPQALDVTALLGSVTTPDSRPYVVLKYAQTLDGRIATRTGDSKWISGEPERRASHALRAACDAVLVGIRTVIADDPQLTVRLVPGASPMRVVLDTTLRVPSGAQLLATTLAVLRDAGIRSLLVEGGAAVITSFLRQRLVDRVVVGIAPTILGAGTEAVGDLSVARVCDGLRLTGRSLHALGEDIVIAGDVV